MKSYLAGLLFLLALVSCTSKNEVKPQKTIDYGSMVVGTISGHDTLAENSKAVAEKWSGVVKHKLNLNDSVQFKNFRILRIKTVGSDKENSYLLTADDAGGTFKVGTLVLLTKDNFYFDVEDISGRKTGRIIICQGVCEDNSCLPYVVVSGNEKHLVCSGCVECEKITGYAY